MDTINLVYSKILDSKSDYIKKLKFNIDKENWVEDIDLRDNGCILLKKNQSND